MLYGRLCECNWRFLSCVVRLAPYLLSVIKSPLLALKRKSVSSRGIFVYFNTFCDWLIVQNCPKSVDSWKISSLIVQAINLLENILKTAVIDLESDFREHVHASIIRSAFSRFFPVLVTSRFELNICFLHLHTAYIHSRTLYACQLFCLRWWYIWFHMCCCYCYCLC